MNTATSKMPARKRSVFYRFQLAIKRHWVLYLMLLPMLTIILIFSYGPMGGLVIAFQNYRPALGIMNSPFVGLQHFRDFFGSVFFGRVVRNTLLISFWGLVWGFPAAIIFALLLNELVSKRLKKAVQTATYMPHFISVVVAVGITRMFINHSGIINDIRYFFGLERIVFLNHPEYFRTIFVASGIWQGLGFNSIIYVAALAGVSTELYDAALVDGANRFRKIWHVSIPGIMPTISIMLILAIGGMLSVGAERILLLYNPGIYETADVISTFVFRRGIAEGRHGFAAAVGMFNSVINFVLLLSADRISKMMGQRGLF